MINYINNMKSPLITGLGKQSKIIEHKYKKQNCEIKH